MGKFIDQVGRNNQIQLQTLTYKQEQAKQKAEIQAIKTRDKEKVIELEYLFNTIFEQGTSGKVTGRKWTPDELNLKCQQLKHRNGMIRDLGEGNTHICDVLNDNYEKTLKKVYTKYKNDYMATQELIKRGLEQPPSGTTQQPQKNKTNKKTSNGFFAVLVGILTAIAGIIWGLISVAFGETKKK